MAEGKNDKATLGTVHLENVRLSFANIFRPQEQKADDGTVTAKFNCAFLMSKTDEQGRKNALAIKKAADEVKAAKWGKDIPKFKPEKVCLRDGDLEDYDGYQGMLYCSASNTRQPVIVDRNRKPLQEKDGKPYSGCYVNAVIRVWAQDNKHGKRINASLEAIQFYRDGDAFGARPVDPMEAFKDLSGSDDDLSPLTADDDSLLG